MATNTCVRSTSGRRLYCGPKTLLAVSHDMTQEKQSYQHTLILYLCGRTVVTLCNKIYVTF